MSTMTSTRTTTTYPHRRTAARGATVGAATYRWRRTIAGAAVTAILGALGLGLHGVLTGPGDVPASAAGAGTARAVPTADAVRAEPGDTLWDLAQSHRGDVPLRRYLGALVELNGGTTAIQAGQLVRLP